jgi:hypothetical protein
LEPYEPPADLFMEYAMNRARTEKETRRVVEEQDADRRSQRRGDDRTPDKNIGQVEYADNEGGGEQRSQGGSTRTTTLEDFRVKSQADGPAAYSRQQSEPMDGPEGQRRRDQISKMQKAEGEIPRANHRSRSREEKDRRVLMAKPGRRRIARGRDRQQSELCRDAAE